MNLNVNVMEMALVLRKLIEDKDEMTQSQKQIIDGIQNDIDTDTDITRLKLEEAHDIKGVEHISTNL